MKLFQIFFLALTLLITTSCNKDDATNLTRATNCPFVENDNDDGLIDEVENQIMIDCLAEEFKSGNDLQEALIPFTT